MRTEKIRMAPLCFALGAFFLYRRGMLLGFVQCILAAALAVSSIALNACVKKPQPEPAPVEPVSEPVIETTPFIVRSVPPGAAVRFSTGETCTTPCTVDKPSDSQFSITVSQAGFKTSTIKIGSNIQRLIEYNKARGWSEAQMGSLHLAKQQLVPNPVDVTLEPEWRKR